MKKTFLFLASVLLMVFTANISLAEQGTDLNWITAFNKIEVRGNVHLYLLSGDKNRVKMTGNYYSSNALVQVENGVLRITCYSAQRLDVWVTASDLRTLMAYDHVLVQSERTFSALELIVQLFDEAKADLNLDCLSVDIKLNNCSMANLSGSAMESTLTANYAATLNSTEFADGQNPVNRMSPTWETTIEFVGLKNADELADPFAQDKPSVFKLKTGYLTSSASYSTKLEVPVGVTQLIVTRSLVN